MWYLLLCFLLLQRCFAFEGTIRDCEQRYDIPANLLQAIAIAESGRANGEQLRPWPWTVQANGQGYYCSTKMQAIILVHHFQSQGIKNIDVGYMQINLKSHPMAFQNLEAAFDQVANICYAAKFLKSLYDRHKSWTKAVAYYHSSKPDFYSVYVHKVYKILQSLSLQDEAAQGLVRFAPYQSDRALAFKPKDLPLVVSRPHAKSSLKVRSYQVKLIYSK